MFKCMSLEIYVPVSLRINTMAKLSYAVPFSPSLLSLPRAPLFTDTLDTYFLFFPFTYYKPHFLCKLNLLTCSVRFHFLPFLSRAP